MNFRPNEGNATGAEQTAKNTTRDDSRGPDATVSTPVPASNSASSASLRSKHVGAKRVAETTTRKSNDYPTAKRSREPLGLADRQRHRRAAGLGSRRSDGGSSSDSSRSSVAATVASDGPPNCQTRREPLGLADQQRHCEAAGCGSGRRDGSSSRSAAVAAAAAVAASAASDGPRKRLRREGGLSSSSDATTSESSCR